MSDLKPILGHDPLDWMNELTQSPAPQASQAASVAPAPAQAAPAPAPAKPTGPLQLEENLTIRHIASVYAWLKERVNLQAPVSLDLSRVSQIDTSGMQLLLSLKRQLAKETHSLKLVGLTQDTLASIKVAGLESELLA